jgi:predicted metal-binding protein
LALEQKANNVFEQYVKLYYDFAISSVYFADTPEPGFNASFLIKKELQDVGNIQFGNWDGIHIVSCTIADNKCSYRVISTVMITMETNDAVLGKMSIAGSCAKSSEQTVACPADFSTNSDMFHIKIIGKMIEANETILRQEVTDTYINRQRAIINSERNAADHKSDADKEAFLKGLQAAQQAARDKANN